MDPLWLALSYLQRRKFDQCLKLCVQMLTKNPLDQAAWFLKVRCLTEKNYIDDTELEEQAIGDILMDSNATADNPRPGTSLSKPKTARPGTSSFGGARPMSSTGRPITGFARPGTQSIRPTTGATSVGSLQRILTASRGSTARPTTAQGRLVRLATASIQSLPPDANIDVSRLDLKKYSRRPALAKALCDYLLFVDQNPRQALSLCSMVLEDEDSARDGSIGSGNASASSASSSSVDSERERMLEAKRDVQKDWWWWERMGKSFYRMGLLREAEQRLKTSLQKQEMLLPYLELGKVYIRLDDPKSALDVYECGENVCPSNPMLICASARIYDEMGDSDKAKDKYCEVLAVDASNVEAIASLGAFYFYDGKPELAMRFYKRLLHLSTTAATDGDANADDEDELPNYGSSTSTEDHNLKKGAVSSPSIALAASCEMWNNIALCCMETGQIDLVLPNFSRALQHATESAQTSDIWHNIALFYVKMGDLTLAYQAFRISAAANPDNAESLNALGVLDMRRGNLDSAKVFLASAREKQPFMHEPCFNGALLARRMGDIEEASKLIKKAKELSGGAISDIDEIQAEIDKELMCI